MEQPYTKNREPKIIQWDNITFEQISILANKLKRINENFAETGTR